jgi:hypothetical protein
LHLLLLLCHHLLLVLQHLIVPGHLLELLPVLLCLCCLPLLHALPLHGYLFFCRGYTVLCVVTLVHLLPELLPLLSTAQHSRGNQHGNGQHNLRLWWCPSCVHRGKPWKYTADKLTC